MKTMSMTKSGILFGAACALCIVFSLSASRAGDNAENVPEGVSSDSASQAAAGESVAVAVARERAKLMHDIYEATLDVMHDHYFHGEKAVVPARALEDVFSKIRRKSHVEARWIAVSLKAMSIDHRPQSAFEVQAAHKIMTGESEFEIVEDGYYRRAGAISLGISCVSCHGGLSRANLNSPQFAGLVISVPLEKKTAELD